MKTKLLFLVCVLCHLMTYGQATMQPLHITHLVDNYYVYESYGKYNDKVIGANAMYLVTKEGVVLFDTPWDSSYYQPLLDSIWARHQKRVIMCISTHFHTDRTGGLKYFAGKGIKTYTTKMTDSFCVLHKDHRAKYLITADTVFHVAGYTFQTYYPGPGHTKDNIVIWIPKERILYGSCFIKSVDDKSLGNLEDANVGEWASSLQRVQNRFPNPNYVIVGHNNWQNKNSIQHTLRLLSAYWKK